MPNKNNQLALFGLKDKIEKSIARLKYYEQDAIDMNPDGYWLAFSGGKDSIVVYDLVKKSGVKHKVYMNLTTVDPPELIKFIRLNYKDVIFLRPPKSMYQLIVHRGAPCTRITRDCCRYLKEYSGSNNIMITGIRWQESNARNKRQLFEACYKNKTKKYLNAIIDWNESEIWQYIHDNNLAYPKLYDDGFKRIGCILCPMATPKEKNLQIARFPKFKQLYIHAFSKMLQVRIERNRPTEWKTGEEVFNWWIANNNKPEEEDSCQLTLFGD